MEWLATGQEMSLMDKLGILTDAAKYVAHTIVLAYTDTPNKNYYTIQALL